MSKAAKSGFSWHALGGTIPNELLFPSMLLTLSTAFQVQGLTSTRIQRAI